MSCGSDAYTAALRSAVARSTYTVATYANTIKIAFKLQRMSAYAAYERAIRTVKYAHNAVLHVSIAHLVTYPAKVALKFIFQR